MYRVFLTLSDRKMKRLGKTRLVRTQGELLRVASSPWGSSARVTTRYGCPGIIIEARFANDFARCLSLTSIHLYSQDWPDRPHVTAEWLNKPSLAQARRLGWVI